MADDERTHGTEDSTGSFLDSLPDDVQLVTPDADEDSNDETQVIDAVEDDGRQPTPNDAEEPSETPEEDKPKDDKPAQHNFDKGLQKLQQEFSAWKGNLSSEVASVVRAELERVKDKSPDSTPKPDDPIEKLLAMTDEEIDQESLDPIGAATTKATREIFRQQRKREQEELVRKSQDQWKQKVESIRITGEEPSLSEMRAKVASQHGDDVFAAASQAAWARTKKALLRVGPTITQEAVDGMFEDFVLEAAAALAKRRSSSQQPAETSPKPQPTASTRHVKQGASTAASISSRVQSPTSDYEVTEKWASIPQQLVTPDFD